MVLIDTHAHLEEIKDLDGARYEPLGAQEQRRAQFRLEGLPGFGDTPVVGELYQRKA